MLTDRNEGRRRRSFSMSGASVRVRSRSRRAAASSGRRSETTATESASGVAVQTWPCASGSAALRSLETSGPCRASPAAAAIAQAASSAI